MSGLYLVNVTIHVLAAFVWLGGMLFLAAVGAPVLRRVEPPELRAELFSRLGEQFRRVGWTSIALLLITGTLNLYFRGVLRWEVLGDAGFWGSRYGVSLAWKLVLVGLMVVFGAIHDFVLGPAASRLRPGSVEALRARRRAALLARTSAVLGVALIVVAVRLARGG